MKTSGHFDDDVSNRPDRVGIRDEWVRQTRDDPEFKEFQENGRIAQWIFVSGPGRWLRVVLLEDHETVHTKHWDRGFPKKLKRFEDNKEWRMVRCR